MSHSRGFVPRVSRFDYAHRDRAAVTLSEAEG